MYSEQQLRLIIDTIPTLAWSARADGAAEFFNRRWLEYAGLSDDEAREWGWSVALHPDDRDRLVTFWRSLLTDGEAGEIEARLRRHDGQFRWFLFRASPLRDKSGEFVQWYGINIDIEDRKRIENALRQSEQQLRVVVENIAGLVAVMSSEGEVEFVNQLGLQYFGRTLDELTGWRTSDAVHPDDLPGAVTAWMHSVQTGNPYEIDHRLRRSDGIYRWFHARGRPLHDSDGNITRWYVLLTDIEERKAAEEKLRSQDAYLSEAQKLSHTGSFGWNLTTGDINWSPETFNIFGFEPSSAITIERILERVHPEDREAVHALVEIARDKQKELDFEHRLLLPDGAVKYLHVVGHPWQSPSGSVEFVGAVTDISELKIANEKLLRSEESLLEAQKLSKAGSFRLDVLSGVVTGSPELYRIWGISAQQDGLDPDSWLSRIHPEDRQRVENHFEVCMRQNLAYESEYRIVLPDESIKYVYSVGRSVFNASGELVEFIGTTFDVTERHRLERALQHERDRLRLLLDLNNRVASQLDLRELFQAMSSELRRVFKSDFIGVALPDESGKYLRQLMVDYPAIENRGVFREGGMYPIDASCSGVALRSGKPFMISNLSEGWGYWRRDKDFSNAVRQEPFQSGCFLPMIASGQTLGVLQVTSLRESAFTAEDLEFLEQVAGQVSITLRNALQYEKASETKDRLHAENVALREHIDQALMFEEIVGSSAALQNMLSTVMKVAPTDSTVLITGETGTGKELIARAIHKRSTRANRAFVGVNCASIPPALVASELFGHEKGAFTGALQQRQGRFELAHSGTIFLDEVGELPAETQVTLLRVLQERQFERVGGNRLITTDVRVVAATNRDLAAAVNAGCFRSDLFYRLNVFPIHVPPLRDRKEDIPMLVEYFVRRFADKMGKRIRTIDKRTLESCKQYSWPGNIRELQNIVERSVILCTTEVFSIDHSWLSVRTTPDRQPAGSLKNALRAREKELIEAALSASKGKIAGPDGAAAKLGMPASTLDSKLKQLRIKRTPSGID